MTQISHKLRALAVQLALTRAQKNHVDKLGALAAEVETLERALQQRRAYAKANPLGGPAKMFYAIAERIEAGDDFHAVLADYGVVLLDLQQRRAQDNGQASEPRQQEASQAGRRLADAESKSGTGASPAQQAQPFTWVKWIKEGDRTHQWLAWAHKDDLGAIPLYTAPPQQDEARELVVALRSYILRHGVLSAELAERIRAYLDKTKEGK